MINYIDVPYYSQFNDVSVVEWQKSACGIAAMAMQINFLKPNSASVMTLLNQGINSGAYQKNVGWKHYELAALAEKYGLVGKVHNFSNLNNQNAFIELKDALADGPLIASIYNKFDPVKYNWLGHLVVVTGYDENFVFYQDPASTTKVSEEQKIKKISHSGFLRGWKKRFITVRDPNADILQSNSMLHTLERSGIRMEGILLQPTRGESFIFDRSKNFVDFKKSDFLV